ncbi:MAG TPA: DUF4382 domain-containing protein [Sunxiuqinia sp.]|nr:DUF4382 domain-containing protein [Sunxiuqinia sp.]
MKSKIFSILGITLITLFAISCKKNDESPGANATGQLNVKMTDAPSDDADISGVFITVAKVKIDSQEVEGFQKQTFNISALQKGKTKLLLEKELDVKNYSSMTLILAQDYDAEGNEPGCYVLTKDGQKHNLASSAQSQFEVSLNKDFSIDANQNTNLVIDMNLRKSIQREDNNSQTNYAFVNSTELQSAFRMVSEDESGSLEGKVNINTTNDLQFIVYVYKKGDYDFVSQTQGQGQGNVMFADAVASAMVNTDGTYQLPFLQPGEYEVHVASYSRSTTDGVLNFTGMANAISLTQNILLNEINVSSSQTIKLDISITISS